MARGKEVLASFDNKQTHQVVKLTKNATGALFLEVVSNAGIRSKVAGIIEYARGRRMTRRYDLGSVSAVVVREGLRIEQANGDFYFVDIPQDEARKFVDVIDKSTSFMQGLVTP